MLRFRAASSERDFFTNHPTDLRARRRANLTVDTMALGLSAHCSRPAIVSLTTRVSRLYNDVESFPKLACHHRKRRTRRERAQGR